MRRRNVQGGVRLAVLLIALAMWFLPVLVVDREHLEGTLQTGLSASLGRRVTIGAVSMAPYPMGFHLRDVAIGDDPTFARSPFFTVPSVKVSFNLLEYVLSGTVQVTELALDKPTIVLRVSPQGAWNVSSLGAAMASVPDLDLGGASVKFDNGRVELGPSPLLDNVAMTMPHFAAEGDSAFTLSARVVNGGTLRIDGSLGTLEPGHLLTTSTHANIALTALHMASSGWNTLGGVVTMTGGLVSDGLSANLDGEVRIKGLTLAPSGVPTKDPLQFEFTLRHDMSSGAGQFTRGRIRFATDFASLGGNYSRQNGIRHWKLALEGNNLHVGQLADLLPAMGLSLPAGSGLHDGLASTRLSLEGADDQLVTTGTLSVYGARLTGFDLGTKLAQVGKLSGLNTGPDAEIHDLNATLRIARDGIMVDQIKLLIPSIGEVSGRGAFTPANQIAFELQAHRAEELVSFLVEGSSAEPLFKPAGATPKLTPAATH